MSDLSGEDKKELVSKLESILYNAEEDILVLLEDHGLNKATCVEQSTELGIAPSVIEALKHLWWKHL